MLTRPPPPQCRSFFFGVQPLHGCWHAIISDPNKNATTRPGSYMCACIFIHSKLCTAHLIASLTSLFCVHVHFRFSSEQLWDRLIGLILKLEPQRCDCHLIVIRSKLASAGVFISSIDYVLSDASCACGISRHCRCCDCLWYWKPTRLLKTFFTLCSNNRCWFKVLVLTHNTQRVCIAVTAVLTHNTQRVCIAGTVCLCVATYAPHAAGSRHYMWRPSLPFIVMAALAASSWW